MTIGRALVFSILMSAVAAGYEVAVASSGPAERIAKRRHRRRTSRPLELTIRRGEGVGSARGVIACIGLVHAAAPAVIAWRRVFT